MRFPTKKIQSKKFLKRLMIQQTCKDQREKEKPSEDDKRTTRTLVSQSPEEEDVKTSICVDCKFLRAGTR